MAVCEHDPKHAQGKCPDMTKQAMHDFSSTPEKGLPHHVGKVLRLKRSKT